MSDQKRKILIVSSSFFPLNSPRSFRATELAKEFARQGNQVTVITHLHPDQQKLEREFGLRIVELGKRSLPAIKSGSGGVSGLFFRGLNRGLNLLFEYPNIELMYHARKALLRETQSYDLLISIAVPHPIHWGVAWAGNPDNSRYQTWVADCGDPYMGNEIDSFRKLFYFGYLEKWFCRKADFITIPIEEARKGYYPEFQDKIRVIPQGFKFEDVQVSGKTEGNPVPTFAYAGAFIPGMRDPRELLTYLIQQNQDYKFIIYTKQKDLIQPYIDKAGGKIVARSYVPRADLMQVLSRMDFLVNFENGSNRMAPSKLIDYAILDKPILSIPTGKLNAKLVDQFLKGDFSSRYIVEDPNRFRIERVCEQFIKLHEQKVSADSTALINH